MAFPGGSGYQLRPIKAQQSNTPTNTVQWGNLPWPCWGFLPLEAEMKVLDGGGEDVRGKAVPPITRIEKKKKKKKQASKHHKKRQRTKGRRISPFLPFTCGFYRAPGP